MSDSHSSSELAFIVDIVIKVGMEADFEALSAQTAKSARAEEGCRMYQYFRDREDPRRFTLVERFRDEAAFIEHGKRLREELGPPPEGQAFGLPERVSRFFESMSFRRVDIA